MVAISAQNAQERQDELIDGVLDTIAKFDMNPDDLANSVNELLDAVWKDLKELDRLATEVERTDPDHPVNVLLDCLQEKVVSAIEAKSDDDFWAYAKKNGVVFHERAANDFLTPDESQGGIRANQGNGAAYMPAEEEGRTRMVLAALLAMKELGTIDGNIDVTPGGAIRVGAVRKRSYNLIEYTTAGNVPVQLWVCDAQKQAAYGLRGDNCLPKEAFFNSSNPVTKTFLQEIGGLQIRFNPQWRNKIQKFTEGLIESKPFQQVAPRITNEYLREIADVYREMHPGKNPTQGSGDIYVKNKNSEHVKINDSFNAVNKAMREGNRGWPEDSPIKSLPQWLDENRYRDNQITNEYLRKIVEVYREMNGGKNPTQDSGDIYVSDGRGKYVKIDNTFNAVNTAMHQGNRGWPKDSPIKSLPQWLEANGYQNSKRSPTQATEGHDAAQLRARGGR